MNDFLAKEPELRPLPVQIALMGPPGGGKTFSALLMATGIQRVHAGPIVMIDTERRARGYHKKFGGAFEFLLLELEPPFRPSRFREAVMAQMPLNPSCIIVDSAADEHEGPGGVLEWHDEEVPRMGGNEHAAWGRPKADRKMMLGAFRQILVPMIFCFRAREKTEQYINEKGKRAVRNIGWVPIAPLEFVHSMDLVCHLPPSSEGTPIWKMRRGEVSDNDDEKAPTLKTVPEHLRKFIVPGPITADFGEALARWAAGSSVAPKTEKKKSPIDQYGVKLKEMLTGDVDALTLWWAETSETRLALNIPDDRLANMEAAVMKVLNPDKVA